MTDQPNDDLAPALGGERAAPEPEPQAHAGDPPPETGAGALPPEFEQLFAELGASAELGAIFNHVGQLAQLSQGFQTLVEETLEVVEQRLPETINAFEGLLGALGEVFEPLFRDEPPRSP